MVVYELLHDQLVPCCQHLGLIAQTANTVRLPFQLKSQMPRFSVIVLHGCERRVGISCHNCFHSVTSASCRSEGEHGACGYDASGQTKYRLCAELETNLRQALFSSGILTTWEEELVHAQTCTKL